MADRDKGKEKALEPLEGTNKRKKMENTSGGQDAEAAAGNKKETEAKEDTDVEFEEKLEGTETEYSDEDKVLSTSDEFDVLCSPVVVSPEESSTNNPKGIKKKKMNVELAAGGNNQDEELILSPKESSTNNPKGMKMKRVREEEEEEDVQEDKEKKLKADSLSDTGTSKFPTSPPIDKFMDSDKMRSPPGGL